MRRFSQTQFETKLAIVLDDGLATGQKANVTGLLARGVAATDPSLVGEPHADGSATAPCR